MPPRLLQLTTRLPRVAPEALFGAAHGPRMLWEPREGGRAFAGVGIAHQLEARGEDRFAELVGAAEELWATIEDVRDRGCDDAPPPLLLGGLAFATRDVWAAPWGAFGDGSFVLPRWLLVVDAEQAFLRVVVPAREGVAVARARLVSLAARLGSPHPDPLPLQGRGGIRVEHMGAGVWRSMVVDALRRIDAHELDKLVAARCSVVRAPAPIDVLATLARLRGPGVLFAHQRGEATFLGLSPERLVARAGGDVRTEALAGTGTDPVALAASAKDRVEHAFVVDGIRQALSPLCAALDAPDAPRVRALPGLCHLWTPITATLVRPVHVLELVQRLHPTPAVAGTPAARAVAWIAAHEPVPRGWYAGPVGFFDARGDGDFAVAIRSGIVEGSTAWLWAGAGIVPASDPDREYGETQAKQRTLLGALGVPA